MKKFSININVMRRTGIGLTRRITADSGKMKNDIAVGEKGFYVITDVMFDNF